VVKVHSVRYYRNLTARVSARPDVRLGEDSANSGEGAARSDPATARCCWWESVRREERNEHRNTVEMGLLQSGFSLNAHQKPDSNSDQPAQQSEHNERETIRRGLFEGTNLNCVVIGPYSPISVWK